MKQQASTLEARDFVRLVGATHHEKLRPYAQKIGEVVKAQDYGIFLVAFDNQIVDVPRGLLLKVEQDREPYHGPARTFTITLALPPVEASANFRGHTKTKAVAIAAYRQECRDAYLSARLPVLRSPVRIDLAFFLCPSAIPPGRINPRDQDNARFSAKAAQDALQDAGVLAEGDGHRFVKAGTTTLYTREDEHQGQAKLVMTLTEMED
jgi:hypothetical protein